MKRFIRSGAAAIVAQHAGANRLTGIITEYEVAQREDPAYYKV
jgi:hypothetical protein